MAMPTILFYRPFSVRFEVRSTNPKASIGALLQAALDEGKPSKALAALIPADWSTPEVPALRYWRTTAGYVLEACVQENETAEQLVEAIRTELVPLGWEIVGPP